MSQSPHTHTHTHTHTRRIPFSAYEKKCAGGALWDHLALELVHRDLLRVEPVERVHHERVISRVRVGRSGLADVERLADALRREHLSDREIVLEVRRLAAGRRPARALHTPERSGHR